MAFGMALGTPHRGNYHTGRRIRFNMSLTTRTSLAFPASPR